MENKYTEMAVKRRELLFSAQQSQTLLWNSTAQKTWNATKRYSLTTLFSLLKGDYGSKKSVLGRNQRFTAVEILKPYQVFQWCHGDTVNTSPLSDPRMAVMVCVQGTHIIETIHLLYVLLCLSLALVWLLAALWYLPVMSYLIKQPLTLRISGERCYTLNTEVYTTEWIHLFWASPHPLPPLPYGIQYFLGFLVLHKRPPALCIICESW